MQVGSACIEELIDRLPRSPFAVLLQTGFGQKIKNKPSLSIPPGDRLSVLNDRGRAALKGMSFKPSALRWLDERNATQDYAKLDFLDRATLPLVRHLNRMPVGMRLVVEAARPSSKRDSAVQTGIYEMHRRSYIRLLGNMALHFPDHFASVDVKPFDRVTLDDKADRPRLRLGLGQTAQMRDGSMPEGWSIEHIKARGYHIDSRPKNRIGNLMLMPICHNAWTAQLEQLQHAILFQQGKESPAKLIICAEPVKGPVRGYFAYGADKPVTIDPRKLQALLHTELGTEAFRQADPTSSSVPVHLPSVVARDRSQRRYTSASL